MTSTYQLGPGEGEKFVPSVIDSLIATTAEKLIDEAGEVEVGSMKSVAQGIADGVKQAVIGAKVMPRHKLIVQTVITKTVGQSMLVTSKCLWNQETDNYSTFSKTRDDGWTFIVLLFATYSE